MNFCSYIFSQSVAKKSHRLRADLGLKCVDICTKAYIFSPKNVIIIDIIIIIILINFHDDIDSHVFVGMQKHVLMQLPSAVSSLPDAVKALH